MQFEYEMEPSIGESIPFYYFIFRKNDLLVFFEKNGATIPFLSDITEITHKIEEIFGNGLLETHKIEVDNMIS